MDKYVKNSHNMPLKALEWYQNQKLVSCFIEMLICNSTVKQQLIQKHINRFTSFVGTVLLLLIKETRGLFWSLRSEISAALVTMTLKYLCLLYSECDIFGVSFHTQRTIFGHRL